MLPRNSVTPRLDENIRGRGEEGHSDQFEAKDTLRVADDEATGNDISDKDNEIAEGLERVMQTGSQRAARAGVVQPSSLELYPGR